MSTFGATPIRVRKSKWGPEDEKTVMSNVANILPPNLPPDVLNAFLLRFQLEEVQYKMNHLQEERKNILYGETLINNMNPDQRGFIHPDVRARDALVKERSQILNAIEKIFPVFRPPLSLKFAVNQTVKALKLPSQHAISVIMGNRCSTMNGLEQSFRVKISLRPSMRQANGEETDSYILIIGNNSDDVDRCYNECTRMIESSQGRMNNMSEEDEIKIDTDSLTVSFNTKEVLPPWTDFSNKTISNFNQNDEVNGDIDAILKGETGAFGSNNDDILSLPELERYAKDVTVHDLSSVLIEPPPPGLEA
ncbi:hypothetical protein TVAG_293000 [Trichomonas vaginalis G3]|uniref:Splicing factor 1 helix-hairpin domain-containing protein n=1 Tax=Trichomonas vaginalis (strain ATCC PRA-98 / G3) TaxID=412133 RepID=A2EWZ0_TRIV3|nr:pre-mRNA branch point binding [Trichomonas vaginalis G3]EAY02832.1 hypothetical protein TVAG_293000 [Trichomonas vaginalis G3]KAI5525632.1 pre-mRNA branch point binding [Trichomonas vaginalis G3]|eukprot:XP_001315055.1 hypothetical protein [Trichomonas vaginalis G3]